MEGEHVRIASIEKQRGLGNTYIVYHTSADGFRKGIEVYAQDELAAYTAAAKIIRSDRMTARIIALCCTVLVLAAFLLIGVSCSRPSYLETCLKAGKSFSYQANPGSQPDTYTCN
jgi:hypothetical protein